MLASRFRPLALFAVLITLCLPALAGAAEFSAEITVTGRNTPMKSAMYAKGKNVRIESTQGPHPQIMIVNAAKKTMWVLDPAAKTYNTMQVPPQALTGTMDPMKAKPQPGKPNAPRPKLLGRETVNGYVCEKSALEGQGMRTVTWYSKKLDAPIKTEGTSQGKVVFRQELKGIRERKLSDSLFELPKGYKPAPAASRPGAGPGGRRGGMMRSPGGRRGGRTATPPATRR